MESDGPHEIESGDQSHYFEAVLLPTKPSGLYSEPV